MKRAFEFIDEKSHKFWWIESFQEKFVVNYGKIDSIGKYEICLLYTSDAADD